MRKQIIFSTLLGSVALLTAGCSSNSNVWDQFSSILSNASPYLNESEEWDNYSQKVSQQGVIYSPASSADQQFVSQKMDAEYPAAIARLATPFAISDKDKSELEKENQGYRFKYNQIMTVKDKNTVNILGYCVNYDSDRVIDGKVRVEKEEDKIRKHFIYLTKDKPVSIATTRAEFITLVCSQDFYNKNKK